MDMLIEWFVYHKNSVHGPFSTTDVNAQLASGKFSQESFIWWKGEKDWIPIDEWQNNYSAIVKKLESHYNVEWKIKTSNDITDPMSFDDCIEFLKTVNLKTGVFICKKDIIDAWENIFTNAIFLNALEMTRRKFPRVPVVGTAKISKSGSKFSYLVKINVIGEGGIGVTGLVKNFSTGSVIDIKIEAPNFTNPIFAEGTIVYHTPDGVSGLEFSIINAEGRAAIIEYVNRFTGTKNAASDKKAA